MISERTIFKSVAEATSNALAFTFDNVVRSEYGSPVEIKDKLNLLASIDQTPRYPVICFITPCSIAENGSQKSFEPEIWFVTPRNELKYSDEKKEQLFEQKLSLILDEFNIQLTRSKYIENFQVSYTVTDRYNFGDNKRNEFADQLCMLQVKYNTLFINHNKNINTCYNS